MFDVGETKGFAADDINPAGMENHVYPILLLAATPSEIDLPLHIEVSFLTRPFTMVFTVTVIVSEALQVVTVFFSVK